MKTVLYVYFFKYLILKGGTATKNLNNNFKNSKPEAVGRAG